VSPHASTFPEAVEAIQFLTGYAGGWTPFERRREDRTRRFWRPSTAPGLPDLIRDLDGLYGDEIVMGLPQPKRFNGGVGSTTIVWAWVEGRVQVELARLFKPHPTVVLQAGGSSRRLLIWGLNRPVTYTQAMDANRRISFALKAKQRDGDPDRLWIPLPGSRVLGGRAKPVPVRVGRLTTDTYELDRVVRALTEPPARDAWLRAS
jgi:hypothetical protein